LGRENLRSVRVFDITVKSQIVGRDDGLTATASVFARRDVIRALTAHAPLGMDRRRLERAADAVLASHAVVPMLPPSAPGTSPSEAMRRWVERGMEIDALPVAPTWLHAALVLEQASAGRNGHSSMCDVSSTVWA
jgi:hypothetical protein